VRADVDVESEALGQRVLLHGSDDELRALDADAVALGLHALAMRALEDGLDDVARRLVQKQLAAGLVRVSVVRGP
jgi:hypothetical protein